MAPSEPSCELGDHHALCARVAIAPLGRSLIISVVAKNNCEHWSRKALLTAADGRFAGPAPRSRSRTSAAAWCPPL